MPTPLMQRAHDEVIAEDGPTLPDKPRRRTFTAEYKLGVVVRMELAWPDLLIDLCLFRRPRLEPAWR